MGEGCFHCLCRSRRLLVAYVAVCVAVSSSLGGCSRSGLPVHEPERADDLCFDVSFDGQGTRAELRIDARLRRADVLFLVDTTASMEQEIGEIERRLRDDIAPLIQATFFDVEYGVASFADFPNGIYGASVDRPFTLFSPMTGDLNSVQDALGRLSSGDGIDLPESQVEALYQVATGEGLGSYVAPSLGCPSGGFGAPCFRETARPVVLLFTDAPFHNGPRRLPGNEYVREVLAAEPHSYDEALAALTGESIAVLGIWSGLPADPAREDLEILARDTGARGSSGAPLVFDIGQDARGLSTTVVDAIATFADSSKFDVSVELEDPDLGDGIDVRELIAAIRPVSAAPASGIDGIDAEGGRFLGVQAGTEVVFSVDVRNSVLAPSDAPRRFPVRLLFRGDGRYDLGERLVYIVIAGRDGLGCDAFQ